MNYKQTFLSHFKKIILGILFASMVAFSVACGGEGEGVEVPETEIVERAPKTEVEEEVTVQRVPIFEDDPVVEPEAPPECETDAECELLYPEEDFICASDGKCGPPPATSCSQEVIDAIVFDVDVNEAYVFSGEDGGGIIDQVMDGNGTERDPTVKYAGLKITAAGVSDLLIYGNFPVRIDEVDGEEVIVPLIYEPSITDGQPSGEEREIADDDFFLCTPDTCPGLEEQEFEDIEGDIYAYRVGGSNGFIFELKERLYSFVPVVRCRDEINDTNFDWEVQDSKEEESPFPAIVDGGLTIAPYRNAPYLRTTFGFQNATSAEIEVAYVIPEEAPEFAPATSTQTGTFANGQPCTPVVDEFCTENPPQKAGSGTSSDSNGTKSTTGFTLVKVFSFGPPDDAERVQDSYNDHIASYGMLEDATKGIRYVRIETEVMWITFRVYGIGEVQEKTFKVVVGPLPSSPSGNHNEEPELDGDGGFDIRGNFALNAVAQDEIENNQNGGACDWKMIRWNLGGENTTYDNLHGQCNATLLYQFSQDLKVYEMEGFSFEEVGAYNIPWAKELKIRRVPVNNESCNDRTWTVFDLSEIPGARVRRDDPFVNDDTILDLDSIQTYNTGETIEGNWIFRETKNITRDYNDCGGIEFEATSFGGDTKKDTLDLRYRSEFNVNWRDDAIDRISDYCKDGRSNRTRDLTIRIPFEGQNLKKIESEVQFWGCKDWEEDEISRYGVSNECGWLRSTRNGQIAIGTGMGDEGFGSTAVYTVSRNPDYSSVLNTRFTGNVPNGSFNFASHKFQGSITPIGREINENDQLSACEHEGKQNEIAYDLLRASEPDRNVGLGTHLAIAGAFSAYRVRFRATGFDGRVLERKVTYDLNGYGFMRPIDTIAGWREFFTNSAIESNYGGHHPAFDNYPGWNNCNEYNSTDGTRRCSCPSDGVCTECFEAEWISVPQDDGGVIALPIGGVCVPVRHRAF